MSNFRDVQAFRRENDLLPSWWKRRHARYHHAKYGYVRWRALMEADIRRRRAALWGDT